MPSMKIDPKRSTIVCGDNLEWLEQVPDECVDLCYIDPPFFSNRVYEVIWGNGYELRSFGDRFAGGVQHYIEWMRPRIELIHRKLKKTGSLFLHCDSHASHRLRCLLEDVFGEDQFRNFITWKRADTHNDAKGQFPMMTDHLLFFSKTADYKFRPVHGAYGADTLKSWYRYLEFPDGTIRKMTKEELAAQRVPQGARRFNADNSSSPNPRPNLMYSYKGYPHPKNGWRYKTETMKELDRQNRLLFPGTKTGRIMVKKYLDERSGPVVGDLWDDIDLLRGGSSESLGYKTQKPLSLVRRIMHAATDKNDLVLDCFAGSGTTAQAGIREGRRFIVGDVSPVAVRVMAERLLRTCPGAAFEIKNVPRTEAEFRALNGHKFAELVCEVTGWRVNPKKSGDGGVDGWDAMNFPLQVKNHAQSTGRDDIQKFYGALASEKKKKGTFVAWKFSKAALEYVAQVRREHGVAIQTIKCGDLLGSMMIDDKKQTELELLYAQRLPKDWAEEPIPAASLADQKRLLKAAQDVEEKLKKSRRHLKTVA